MSKDSNIKSYFGWRFLVGPIITLVIIFAGMVAGWATYKAALAKLQEDIKILEEKVDENEDRVRGIELKQAGDAQILLNIQSDVSEIKEDVKKLTRNR